MELETETDKLLPHSDDNDDDGDDNHDDVDDEADKESGPSNELLKLKIREHQTDDSSSTTSLSEDTEEGADKPVLSNEDSDDEEDSPNLSHTKNEFNAKIENNYEPIHQSIDETIEITTEIDTTTTIAYNGIECQLSDTVNEPTTFNTNANANIKVIETLAIETPNNSNHDPVNENTLPTVAAIEDTNLKTLTKPSESIGSPNQSLEFYYSANDLYEYEHVIRRHDSRTPDVESGYFEKSDSLYSKEEFEARSSSRQPSQYDQTISESLHNQLNRFDLLIDTIDQRNALNLANNEAERGYWSTIFGQASEIESYDEMSQEKSNVFIFYIFLSYKIVFIKKHSLLLQFSRIYFRSYFYSIFTEAHRALELLEDYHSRLSEPQDRALRIAIERVIRIFKSRLFQALLGKF